MGERVCSLQEVRARARARARAVRARPIKCVYKCAFIKSKLLLHWYRLRN